MLKVMAEFMANFPGREPLTISMVKYEPRSPPVAVS
jgi:hypothetical protein